LQLRLELASVAVISTAVDEYVDFLQLVALNSKSNHQQHLPSQPHSVLQQLTLVTTPPFFLVHSIKKQLPVRLLPPIC